MRLSGQSILATVFPQNLQNGQGPARLPGPRCRATRSTAFGYTIPNLLIDHSMRNPHILPGFWRGVNINQNCVFFECFMDELAHAAGQDPLEFRRKLMGKHPETSACSTPWPSGSGWGKPAPQGMLSRPGANEGVRQLRGGVRGDLGRRRRQQVKVHRIVGRDRPGLCRQPGADRAPDRGLVRLRPVGALLCRNARSRTAAWCRRTSTPTIRCASPRCRRWNRSSCRPAAMILGRGRRADHLRGGAGGAQCLLRGDGQARAHLPLKNEKINLV